MIPAWVYIALSSALFTSLRHIHIKNKCSRHPSEIVIFVTRLAGVVVLMPLVFMQGISVSKIPLFVFVTTLTVFITAFATIIQISLLQREDVSQSIPYLSFIPIFMIPWSMILLREIPASVALIGILLTCMGSYVINLGGKTGIMGPLKSVFRMRTSRLMLLVSFCLAFNTVCDKIAISASSSFSYIYCWTVASTVVMGSICLKRNPSKIVASALIDKHVILQALFWVGGYSCQIFAIGAAFGVSSGTTYVRALTLTNVLFTVIFGGALFKEKDMLRKGFATFLMICGSILIVLATSK